jgi:hypothetical protein
MQWLVSRILSSAIRRPSGVVLWQIPHCSATLAPGAPAFRRLALLAQDASYLAASARIESFS